jgi:hypothetical protein
MKKRGRPTKLNEALTNQICQLLSEGISITATCDALGVTESKYFEWMKKGEQDEQPYSKFREQATRARANGKIVLVRQILADKDWRAKAWYLERCWPNEFGRTAERPLPPRPPEPPPDLSRKIKVGIHGLPGFDLGEFLRMKCELQAAGIKTDFPVQETYEPAHVQNDNDDLEPGKDVNGSPGFTP